MGQQPPIAEQLERIGEVIQEALHGAVEFPSREGIDIFAGEMTECGGNIVLAMTKRREGNISFHVRREVPADASSQSFEVFDYFFGDRNPKIVFSRFHRSHRFNRYTMPPFDTQMVRPMKRRDISNLDRTIGIYSLLANRK